MTTRILLVDDHAAVRHGLRNLIEQETDFKVVGEAADARDVLPLVERAQPDVAVLDVRLPDGDGVDVCRAINGLKPGVKCVLLTAYLDVESVIAAFLAGASGFVLKQIRGGDVVSCIRSAASGASHFDVSLVRRSFDSVDSGEQYGFDSTEAAIVMGVIKGKTNRAIADELSLPERTVARRRCESLEKVRAARV
jgi:two-component system, NarL family, response regulator DevR